MKVGIQEDFARMVKVGRKRDFRNKQASVSNLVEINFFSFENHRVLCVSFSTPRWEIGHHNSNRAIRSRFFFQLERTAVTSRY